MLKDFLCSWPRTSKGFTWSYVTPPKGPLPLSHADLLSLRQETERTSAERLRFQHVVVDVTTSCLQWSLWLHLLLLPHCPVVCLLSNGNQTHKGNNSYQTSQKQQGSDFYSIWNLWKHKRNNMFIYCGYLHGSTTLKPVAEFIKWFILFDFFLYIRHGWVKATDGEKVLSSHRQTVVLPGCCIFFYYIDF